MKRDRRAAARRPLLSLVALFALTGLAALDVRREALALLFVAILCATVALAALDASERRPPQS